MLSCGNQLVIVDANNARIVCDQCRIAHIRCNRTVPACNRCLKSGIVCTRRGIKYNELKVNVFQVTEKKVVPTTWDHIINNYTETPIMRFHLQRYVLPFGSHFPKPAVVKQVLDLCNTIIKKPSYSLESKVLLQLDYTPLKIQETLDLAADIFFHRYNTLKPLFSRQAFRSRPRSPTLHKIIRQVGLGFMPQTDLTKAAMIANAFDPLHLFSLPYTLDTFQCLLLAQFGIRQGSLNKFRFRLSIILDRFVTLFGLHINNPRSPLWLERTLALNFEGLASFHSSVGQYVSWSKVFWLKISNVHLNPQFLSKHTNHFPCIDDRIHFIASQSMYHSYSIVTMAARAKALTKPNVVDLHIKLLHSNFLWAWSHLSTLPHSPLLNQSRIILATRYYANCIEIIKMSRVGHIQQGLAISIQIISLAKTLTPSIFGEEYIFTLVPAIAFIIDHFKSHPNYTALNDAIGCLKQSLHVNNISFSAKAYLQLVEFFSKRQNISTFTHYL
ncbi:hypothetical protein DSO57_1016073 [Entomophthora muscae]|uniref:Uncharacterized protein n=1 Tax=Entomophthora muscae TaxID=34485 RepID=A0ACC2S709_9FUNG|nr:hypothetical protein DSO57_1016073 [Entomophthora muscae]